MTWPLSGWIFSSSSSSSMEEDDDTELNDEDGIALNDDDDQDNSFQEDGENNGQNVGVLDEKDAAELNQSKLNYSPEDEHIPTAIAIPGNALNKIVTIAVPGTGISDGMKQRRLQRRATMWTNEDELELLRGFLEYTSQNGISGHRLHQQEAATFYRTIKPKIQLSCDKNQLIEKLRRLKRKYQTISSKINSGEKAAFRGPHDRSTFDISRKIWGRKSGKTETSTKDNILNEAVADINPNFSDIKVKREDTKDEFEVRDDPRQSTKRRRTLLLSGEVSNSNEMSTRTSNIMDDISTISGLVEEVARGCLSPFFKELRGNGLPPFCFIGRIQSSGAGEAAEERWRKQQALEMEVYMKRLELVQEEIRVALEELRSREGGNH